METIRIYEDGNQICAIIGEMPEQLAAGFGDTAAEALRALAAEIDENRIILNISSPPRRMFPGGGDIDIAAKGGRAMICDWWRDGDCLYCGDCAHKNGLAGGCSAPFGEVEAEGEP